MKKGFTLIELLAVIVLLGFIFALTFPKVLEIAEKKEVEIDDATKKLIYNGVDQYMRNDIDTYPKKIGNTYCFKIDTIDKENLIAISVNEYLDKYVKVKIGKTNSYSIVEGKDLDKNICINSIEIKNENSIFKVNDYIKMTPTSTSYTISKESTGYTSDQIINPSELNLWRIIQINENGTIEMVSENVSSTNVYFTGQTGYLNFVGVLNEIASQYGNSKYVVDSRIIGYNGQTEYITNTSKFTDSAPWTSDTSDNSNESLGGGDIMYEADTNLVIGVLGTLVANNPSGTATSYWLASRFYGFSRFTGTHWGGRNVSTSGVIVYSSDLYNYNSGWRSYSSSYAIRPILTLKSGLTATGSGTSTNPWVLE